MDGSRGVRIAPGATAERFHRDWTDTCEAGRPGGRTVTHPSVDDSQRRAVAGSDARLEAIAVVVSARAAVARELPLLLAISSHADAL